MPWVKVNERANGDKFMNKLFENWRRFMAEQNLEEGWAGAKGFGSLNAPIYMDDPNKAGEAQKAVQRGEELKGWDKYAQLVAEAYMAAPEKEPAADEAFERLGHHVLANFPKVASSYNVEFVEGQPYDTAAQMSNELMKTGAMKVSKDFNQSEIFGEMENLFFRAVHDYYGHLRAKGHEGDDKKITKFNLKGELQAFNNHAKMLRGSEMLKAVFTEVIGQACCFLYFGKFPDQKVTFIDDQFDMYKLGRVAGYEIVDGNLVKG